MDAAEAQASNSGPSAVLRARRGSHLVGPAAHTSWARGAAALRVLRVGQWRHFVVLPAASMPHDAWAHQGSLHQGSVWLQLARGSVVAGLALAYSYGLNAVHDRATDRSTRKNPLAGVSLVTPETRALVWTCGALALVGAMPGGAVAVACVMTSLLAGAVYSAGPRLKAYPFLGTLLNVGIFLPLMGVAGAATLPDPALPITFAALLLQNQLWHEREDLDEDRASGALTTAAVLGERGTAAAVIALGAAGVIGAAVTCAGRGRWTEAAASTIACALASAVPLLAAPEQRRAAHRCAAITGGALVYVAGLVVP
jgi:4-hydroxybenzoate polyprenyltransferase